METITLDRPTGPQFRDLTLEQQRDLTAWVALTLALGYAPTVDASHGYTRALSVVARRFGIEIKFTADNRRRKNDIPLGRNIPGCVGGSKRKISATRLRPLPGSNIEPWNQREWRI